jgi:phosphopantothenoylcysteine decarboxylase / phosphopantothenate---cysteine ligase
VTSRLEGRLIGLGVTGSIAAYRALELLRALRAEGAEVAVMLTPAATRFVGPLSFAALSRHPVETDVLALLPDGRIGHIVIGDSADAIVVAPATAHWIGTMANGLSGDVVSAACLATKAPVVLAPAMDGDMWTHPATLANVARLRSFGYAIVEPGSGPLASGQSGVGRLAEIGTIVDAVVAALGDRPVRSPDPAQRPPLVDGPTRDADLEGRHVVVTAGGTREPIDPVRFIGNRSTGKMGVAIADAALDRGARVTLIAANVEVALPPEASVVHVESTAGLESALGRALRPEDGSPGFDALVMAAAVSDFRPTDAADAKLARVDGLALQLESTPDLLAGVARAVEGGEVRSRPILVGFAAETGSLDRAAEKLARKGVDLLVANDVSEPGSGFGTDTNRVTILARDGSADELPLQSKRAVADALFDRVVRLLDERDRAAQTDATTEPAREPA